MNYFTKGMTPADIKAKYRELAMQWHPDRPHNKDRQNEATERMKAINAAYHAALKAADGHTETGTDGRDHTYRYNEAHEEAAAEIISQLLTLQMEGVDIALIGAWVWVSGNTKPYKDELGRNGLKLNWHRQREAWYWKPEGWYSRPNKSADLEDLADKYGAKHFGQRQRERRQAQQTKIAAAAA